VTTKTLTGYNIDPDDRYDDALAAGDWRTVAEVLKAWLDESDAAFEKHVKYCEAQRKHAYDKCKKLKYELYREHKAVEALKASLGAREILAEEVE